jgi:hypothetical protein
VITNRQDEMYGGEPHTFADVWGPHVNGASFAASPAQPLTLTLTILPERRPGSSFTRSNLAARDVFFDSPASGNLPRFRFIPSVRPPVQGPV